MKPAALLLRCRVMHDRLRPARNRFVYSVFCLRVDIDKLPALQRWWMGVDCTRLISLHTRDYGPRDGTSLSQWIRPRLAALGLPDDGPIWLQTSPRVFGYVFNPVSFWYCHDRAGALRALVAEVNNTFGEHHVYLVTAPDQGAIHASTVLATRKRLHVSPFNHVQGHYAFQVRETEGTAYVGVDYFDDNGLVLRTSIGGRKSPLTLRSLLSVLPQIHMTGQGDYRWLGMRIYDAQLWRRPPSGAEDPADVLGAPFALRLIYARDIRAQRLVDTSIDEIQRIQSTSLDETTIQQWRHALSRVLVDVRAGDRITAVYLPTQGARFYANDRETGQIHDLRLAHAFFAIWLGPSTRDPALRQKLIGLAR